MKAIGKFIVVEENRESYKSKGGLLLTGEDKVGMTYRKGKIKSVGDLITKLKEGDIIYYNKIHSHEARIEGDIYTVLQERDVAVVI
tara:strand:+ start:1618 stop:1875 length:258 start_codon:yes stop_codon:yes gene_type:complete